MHFKRPFAVALLCLALVLSACGNEEPSNTEATHASTSVTETAQTEPAEPMTVYQTGVQALRNAPAVTVSYSWDQSRTVGTETYTETRVGTLAYTGKGTSDFEALVSEDATYGTYSTHCNESYIGGQAYALIQGSGFVCDMTATEFLDRQIPALPLTDSLYGTVSVSDDGRTYSFSQADSLESWVDTTGSAQLVSASGSVELDDSGRISGVTYRAEYTLGTVCYQLKLSLTLTMGADLTDAQPEYPEECVQVNDLEIPRYLLRTVGAVYASREISAEYTDTLYFGLLQTTRTQTRSICVSGSGNDFAASISSQIALSNVTGSSALSTQVSTYQDGVYSNVVNGIEEASGGIETEGEMRILCEDSILDTLCPLEYVGQAQIADEGDFLCITFSGNDTFQQNISGKIYAIMGYTASLETMADSYTTEAAGGYLTVNKYTGLPTAMGIQIVRTHVFDGVSYRMTYQKDQSLTLSCNEARVSLTGKAVATAADTDAVTPLLYRVTGEDDQQLWLLGTLEVGDSLATQLPEQVLEALYNSDVLAVEYDTDAFALLAASDPAVQSQLTELYYDTSSTVSDQLSEELYQRLYWLMLASGCRNISSDYLKIVVWENQIENLYMAQGSSLTAAASCERYLIQAAQAQEIPVYELDSCVSQLESLTGFSQELQVMLLERLLGKGMLTYCAQLEQMYSLWCQGDAEGLTDWLAARTEGMTEEELALYGEYYTAMYTDRIQSMLETLEHALESGETVFCAVNVAYLLGEDGMLETLTADGYHVERIA